MCDSVIGTCVRLKGSYINKEKENKGCVIDMDQKSATYQGRKRNNSSLGTYKKTNCLILKNTRNLEKFIN